MIKRVIQYFGHRTHNIQVQLLCATFYGLVSLYGVFGSIAIFIKARKMAKRKSIVIVPLKWKVAVGTLILAAMFGLSSLNHHLTYRHLCYEWMLWFVLMQSYLIYKAVKA